MKITIGTIVEINAYRESGNTRMSIWNHEYNRYAVVNSDKPIDGKYWLTNMNQPFMGTISGFYSPEEFTVVE